MTGSGRGEIRALTGLRIVAAAWVVIIHFQAGISQAFGDYAAPVWPLVMSGWMGVDLFFLLSGFVMTVSYLDRMGPKAGLRSVVGFIWARLIRIWPLWAAVTTGMYLFLLFATRNADPATRPGARALVEQLLLVQMWHRDINLGSSFVPPGWSLSVEFLAYLCFPLVVLVLHRLRKLPAVVLVALAVAAMMPLAAIAYRDGLADYFLPWPVRIAGAFLSGGLTCLAVDRLRSSARAVRLSPLVAVLAVVEIIGICFWAQSKVATAGTGLLATAAVVFPVLVGALALSERGISAFLSRETMVVGGRISFALYLVHYPVLQVGDYVAAHVPSLAPASPLGALVQVHLILVSFVAAWVCWRFLEEPCRSWLKDRGPARWARASRVRQNAAPETPAALRPRARELETDVLPRVGAGPGPGLPPVPGVRRAGEYAEVA